VRDVRAVDTALPTADRTLVDRLKERPEAVRAIVTRI